MFSYIHVRIHSWSMLSSHRNDRRLNGIFPSTAGPSVGDEGFPHSLRRASRNINISLRRNKELSLVTAIFIPGFLLSVSQPKLSSHPLPTYNFQGAIAVSQPGLFGMSWLPIGLAPYQTTTHNGGFGLRSKGTAFWCNC